MFNFSSRPMGTSTVYLSAVMMMKEDDSVIVVDPRSKAIVRFTEKCFRSLLDLDGMRLEDAASVKSQSFQAFLAAMMRNGLVERATATTHAYNVAGIRAALDGACEQPGRAILNPPALPTVNINEICAFKCPHCYNDTNRHGVSEMDTEVIVKNVLIPLAGMGCANVMWSGGDPVLTKDKTVYCTKVASSLGMSVATQAAEFSGLFLEEFARAGGRGIQVSLYSSPRHPEIDDNFRGRAGSWQMAVHNIVDARRNGLAVFINMVLFPDNVAELIETAEFAYGLGVDTFRTTIPVMIGRAAQNPSGLELSERQINELLATALALRDRYSSRMTVVTDISERGNPMAIPYSFCSAGMTYMHVAGYTVFPCNFMMDERFCLGSISDQTIDQIWRRSPNVEDFRTTERVAGRCASCPKRESAGGACTDCKAVMWMRYDSFLNCRTVPCEGNAKRCLITVV